MSKYTPWFPGSVTPTRVGVYERTSLAYVDSSADGFSFWNGRYWTVSMPTIGFLSKEESLYQPYRLSGRDFKWRGLTKRSTK